MEGLAAIVLDAVLKGALYASVVVLVGAGAFRRLLAPTLAEGAGRTLRVATFVAAVLVVVLSAVNLVAVLHSTLGFLERGILLDYATQSRHGRATIVRAVLVAALAALAFLPLSRWSTAAWLLAAVAVLGTFSIVSHNAAMPGRWPVPADLLHLTAAVGWAGAVLAVAFLPAWSEDGRDALERAMARVSATGFAAVVILFATGIYSAQLHVGEPVTVLTTRYGWALVTKNVLVVVILGIAALNRWRFLPDLRRGGPAQGFRRALRIEAVLLLAALGATGWLTTSPLPH